MDADRQGAATADTSPDQATASPDQTQTDPQKAQQSAEAAATIATAQMAAAIATQRMIDPAQQADLVKRSLPDLDAQVVPKVAADTLLAAQQPRKAPGPAFGSPEFEKLLDDTTESIARPDSSATPLFDGAESFAEREKLILGAQRSILLETFIFSYDETGEHTADLLIAAVKRGVQVLVMYDSLGSSATSSYVFDRMRNGGVELRAYNPVSKDPAGFNHRNHAKSMIVDGQTAIMGGMNVGNDYAYGGSHKLLRWRNKGHQKGWRDVDVEVAGGVVTDALAHFYADWAQLGADVTEEQVKSQTADVAQGPNAPQPGQGTTVRYIEHRPHEEHDANTLDAYVVAINSSEHTIDIENAYFVPPEPIRKALIAAAQRGVAVRIRTNSSTSSDNTIDVKAAHEYYRQLIAAGVQIYEQDTQMLHAKTATFDGTFSIIGSVNLNGRSNGRDAENLVAINGADTANQLAERFDDKLDSRTTLITPEMMHRENVWKRLEEWSLSRFAWTM